MPPDKRGTVAEIARVLRPGGEVHIADFTRSADPLQAAVSWQVRLFDGVERTRENFTGALPGLFEDAGFTEVAERRRLRTALGTVGLLSAKAR